ncbi:vesicular-fusion protein SEC17 [Coprinopsis marcescibilis]|uniref:Vesicular-fusion protein SEC17 n=1 Tax=Coprinopsis marcescibilis TaxID=230819 RepID=A0A5C3KJN1_COPMA|nr:vesicular-fusion protein SEC17 [Coprinopsis marcescibilis]
MPAKSQAQTLLEKADKKATSTGGWFSSANSKFEEAGDLYQQAANAFKLEKQFKESGDAFAREAECREKCKETLDAGNAWWNAAKAYKRGYPELAIQALQQTISHLAAGGRFRQAADREKEIAQIYLQETSDLSRACDSFLRAGDWYAEEDATATANQCYKDAADLYAELDKFPQAVTLYERVANHSLTSNLTKYSVKEYWLKALLCILAMGDTVTAGRSEQKYIGQDNTFSATREYKFASALRESIEHGDVGEYTAAVVEFDRITKLDNWKTSILLKIKKSIQEEPGLT